jgi:transposase
VIDVALLSIIRRWHFREGMPIREITRRTGLSRNTVRKYLASGVVEPRYPKRKSLWVANCYFAHKNRQTTDLAPDKSLPYPV